MAKKKKKKLPRRFQVRASLDNLQLARTGSAIKLEVDSRGEKLGELHVGRGSLFWWGAHRKIRKRIRWSKFAEMLNSLAYADEAERPVFHAISARRGDSNDTARRRRGRG